MPTKEEIRLFRLQGHNAQALAVQMMAKRLGMTVGLAREALLAAVAKGAVAV